MYNENKDESAFAVFVGNKIDLKARYGKVDIVDMQIKTK